MSEPPEMSPNWNKWADSGSRNFQLNLNSSGFIGMTKPFYIADSSSGIIYHPNKVYAYNWKSDNNGQTTTKMSPKWLWTNIHTRICTLLPTKLSLSNVQSRFCSELTFNEHGIQSTLCFEDIQLRWECWSCGSQIRFSELSLQDGVRS